MPHPPAVEAVDLVKTFGKGARAVHALRGISFQVPAATVFGLLGPNGAGKSTTVRILSTLAAPDAGHASVAGLDVRRAPDAVRRALGYVSQRPGFDPMATGRENLMLQARLQAVPARQARRRTQELLGRFDLLEAADRLCRTWSGGMQRKLDVAMGLVHDPRVLFLDEPTTGLDPQARRELWDEIARLARHEQVSVLLTTHYLEEADQLADHLLIIDDGRIVAQGTPEELKAALGSDTVRLELADRDDAARARAALGALPGVSGALADETAVSARVADGVDALPGVLAALRRAGVRAGSVAVASPSLDDVYLHHAGRRFRETVPDVPTASTPGSTAASASTTAPTSGGGGREQVQA